MSFESDGRYTREAFEAMLTDQAKRHYTAAESPFLSGAPRPERKTSADNTASSADREALESAARQLGLDPSELESHAAAIADRPRARTRRGLGER